MQKEHSNQKNILPKWHLRCSKFQLHLFGISTSRQPGFPAPPKKKKCLKGLNTRTREITERLWFISHGYNLKSPLSGGSRCLFFTGPFSFWFFWEMATRDMSCVHQVGSLLQGNMDSCTLPWLLRHFDSRIGYLHHLPDLRVQLSKALPFFHCPDMDRRRRWHCKCPPKTCFWPGSICESGRWLYSQCKSWTFGLLL